MTCSCFACEKDRVRETAPEPHETFGGHDMRLGRMFLCETCGNKRCPHAADHRHACTNSNKPGQRGSLYENAPIFTVDGTADRPTQPREEPTPSSSEGV